MNNIERLFGGDKAVPGMRSSARLEPKYPIDDEPEEADTFDGHAADEASQHEIPQHEVPEGDDGAEAPRFPLAVLEPLRPGRQLLSAYEPGHPHSERMRQLRTELLLRHNAQSGSMALAVVGAGAGVGRSLLAAELAIVFAQLGRSTLLLDADMRNPSQHTLFNGELRDGLAQAILRGESPTLYGVEGLPTLAVMMAGVCPANPIELLSDGRFESLMDELRNRFDFIIVDTPRFADYADGQVVATIVGHVLTVHRARHTLYKEGRAMMRQLVSTRADILGGVLNQF
jgi:receptor protein-tyrosine kinase